MAPIPLMMFPVLSTSDRCDALTVRPIGSLLGVFSRPRTRWATNTSATHPDRFDAESGEAHYRQALALAELRGMRPLISHCHLGLGTLYRRTGKRQEAQEHLTLATTMYREMDMPFWLEQAEADRKT